ncbi:suppressor of fused domain protein [Antribacter gilvus]|uniref:suppressor of fused domain protein n=1 Tax=Antribacter gilvus TaxID=2304675 RepID=UPI0013DF9C12|nr:suppressor of fused domain protein [Antribacter gilvus]
MIDQIDELWTHFDRSWPGREHRDLHWPGKPIEDAIPWFHVREVRETSTSPWTYVSVGTSLARPDARHEFFLQASEPSLEHVETLAWVAHWHVVRPMPLSHGSVLKIGRPWVTASRNDHLAVVRPYAFPPEIGNFHVGDDHVSLLWLLPISFAEARLIRRHGIGVFEDLLEASELNVVDRNRPPVGPPQAGTDSLSTLRR